MKNIFTLLIAMLLTVAVSAQINITRLDTVSDSNGVHVFVEWQDINPAATEWTVRLGGSGVQNQTSNIAPSNTVSQRKIELTSFNSRIYGWGCFFNQYVKTAWLEIVSNTGSYYGANIAVPSNYIKIGCKPMDAGVGQTFQSNTQAYIMWDYFTISGKYTIQYKVNNGTTVTVSPTCPNWSFSAPEGTIITGNVSTTCGTEVTSKSFELKFPVTPIAPATTTQKKTPGRTAK